MENSFVFNDGYLRQIFMSIQDGILVMDEDRVILQMNPAAKRMTGWKIGGKVPYCTYCQNRRIEEGEERCYLISNQSVPYFLSKMPSYYGEKIYVEMSTALIYREEETGKSHYLLVLRDQSLKQKEEEVRMSKAMIKKLIDARESEHKRLAAELHDGVGQSLYTISVALQAIEARLSDKKLHEYVAEVRNELEKVMNDVKSYSHQLRPQSLDQLGLVPTVHSLISSLKKKLPATSFTFDTNLEHRLNSFAEINIYRVIQEALHNAMKYSSATEVNISLHRTDGKLFLEISDNGVGFQYDRNREGLGLKHMEERVNQLGGTFSIQTSPGKGTKLMAEIPCSEVEKFYDD